MAERDSLARAECLLAPEVCSRIKMEVEEEITATVGFADESAYPQFGGLNYGRRRRLNGPVSVRYRGHS